MTYATLAVLFLVPAAAVAVVATVRRSLGRRWWAVTALTVGVLLVLTVVFDSVMIAADLFRFDDDALLGVRLGLAPLEDLAWPVAAALLLPALWELLGRTPTPAAPSVRNIRDASRDEGSAEHGETAGRRRRGDSVTGSVTEVPPRSQR